MKGLKFFFLLVYVSKLVLWICDFKGFYLYFGWWICTLQAKVIVLQPQGHLSCEVFLWPYYKSFSEIAHTSFNDFISMFCQC